MMNASQPGRLVPFWIPAWLSVLTGAVVALLVRGAAA